MKAKCRGDSPLLFYLYCLDFWQSQRRKIILWKRKILRRKRGRAGLTL